MRLLQRLAIVATLAVATVAPASATTVAPLSLEQMVDASDLVVRGSVESVWVEQDAKGRLWTRATVRVLETLKGHADVDDYVTVEAAGGTLGDLQMVVAGSARYSEGEEAVLFLTDKPTRGVYGTVSMGLGKFTVRPDPRNGAPIVVQFLLTQEKPYDARFLPFPPAEQRVSLDAMEARILARVELGWDGQPIPGLSAERLRSINKLQPGVK